MPTKIISLALFLFMLSLTVEVNAKEKLAFSSNRDGNFEIYIMDANGSNVTRLTNNSASDTDPSISPDGTKIAFVSRRDAGDEEIYVMNLDGSNQTRLTFSPEEDVAPSYGPGGRIAFMTARHVTDNDNNQEIYVMNDDGSSQVRLTTHIAIDTMPSFSGDGSQIAFVSMRDGNLEIYVMSSSGTAQTRLTNSLESDAFPAFDRAGNQITFASNVSSGNLEIYKMASNGGGLMRLTTSVGNDLYPTFNPDGTKIAFISQRDGNAELYVMDSDGTDQIRLTTNTFFDEHPSWGGGTRIPVMIVPGIAGTYAANPSNDMHWLLNRGVAPGQLQIDPLARVYHDLIKTLENIGYVKDKDLFVVNYDWRLVPGPLDGSFDGNVSGITAASISDETFEYGVDYLGLALRRAYERWEQDHPGETLDEVDVIAHSTGGLVSRTYIQSPAYNAVFSGTKKLPKVKNMIMVGVPNRGASKAWNALHNNWNADIAYKALSKIVLRGYVKVLQGNSIPGPDHTININTILDAEGDPDPIKFINQYVPTIRSLLATYDFLDIGQGYGDVNSDPQFSNDWVLDLNAGLDLAPTSDPSLFADRCEPTIIYASARETLTFTKEILSGGEDVLFNFDDLFAGDVPAGTPWFIDIPGMSGGDGTVPTISSTGQFAGDGRVTLKNITEGDPDHTGLMSNISAQSTMLETIGAQFQQSDISTIFAGNQYATILSVISDPVDGFVIDAKGRRLGYSDETGPVTEIPGSIWFGDADGSGWIFGDVARPLRVELNGRGEPYYYMVSLQDQGESGGVVSSGFLKKGEKRSLRVAVGTASISGRVTAANGRGLKGVFMYLSDGNGFQQTTFTNSFGYYRFYEVPAEAAYQISVSSKRYRFDPSSRSLDLASDLLDVNFTSSK